MSLREKITEDMKQAMRDKAAARLSTIRMLLAAIKQREVDERIILDDAQVLTVIEKLLKQRRESIVQFEKGARPDLVAIEQAEVEVLLGYMPAQMGEAEIEAIVTEAIAQTGAKGPADMGKLMAVLKPKLAGRADMGRVSGLVKARLSG
ncbi:MAG: glutamyl-tRNA amidotransferase [Betaproteobacteria bacterium RBG_16_58_11]|nr:MAG: glutamyl-tRNA amidotransferase [Betaproteobacteria bacterium RBG_16_58_11]OFZ98816.1 MAG: glutamyl-tRNA amidotransferase [Betaproteobacteria bacterium RBG_19FT_COMBO_58_11]